MAQGTVAQTMGSQIEYVRKDLELLYLTASTFWPKIKARTDVKAVSNRPSRIPFEAEGASQFRQFDPDGGDMGLGAAPVETYGTLTPVYFLQASQYTAQAEWTTDTDEKAIKDYVSLTQERAVTAIAGALDATVTRGAGDNVLDTVVSVSGNVITVNIANRFQEQQAIDVWTSVGGTLRGTLLVQSVDILNNQIVTYAAPPPGTTTGDSLLVNGSAGVANTGLAGIQAYDVSGNTGTYMGIQRSAFQGKYSTPYIAINGALTPALIRALESLMELSLGQERADASEFIWHCNVDVRDAWENNAILVQRVIQNEVKGDQSVDMLKKRAMTEIAGRDILLNVRATPGRLDGLALKNWFRIESKPMDYYEVGGQTIYPIYGASGGLQASMIFYYVTGVQVGCGQPRLNCYADGITIPTGLFGH